MGLHAQSRTLARLGRSFHTSVHSANKLQTPKESLSFPKGFLATGVHSGIKKGNALDLGLIVSAHPTTSAACFTQNIFKAAPVQVSRDVLLQSPSPDVRALVINSGCANAVTGSKGLEDARAMSSVAGKLRPSENESGTSRALVMSTGVIGQKLPISRVLEGIESAKQTLSTSYESWIAVAQAFMTTDTFPKLRTRKFLIGGKEIRLVGIDKGAGMIHPNMGPPHATLLAFVGTDAQVDPQSLQNALNYAVERSFNCVSIDGDTSTNDTIAVLANGASGTSVISESQTPAEFEHFRQELVEFTVELASLVVRDGEGATKFVKISVEEAPNFQGAKHIASMIARSMLVKTAFHGEDANWGRILCAIGYSNPEFFIDPSKVSVSFVPSDGSGEMELLVNGEPLPLDEARAKKILSADEFGVRVRLGLGKESAAYYTSDLSKEYVNINADYRS